MTDPGSYYINREISWLSFNHRVLQEAKDDRNPLLERLKFLAIYSSNLDEFFKVRVATIKRLMHVKPHVTKELMEPPEELLKHIKHEVNQQRKEFNRVFNEEILSRLAEEGIHFIDEDHISPEHEEYLENYFITEVQPRLEPVFIEDDKQPLFMRDNWIYFAILLKGDSPDELSYALLKLPENLPRFVTLPSANDQAYVIYIDDVIRYYLNDLFPNFQEARAFGIRILRDAELDIEGDLDETLLKKIKNSLKKREQGDPTRLSYDPEIPTSLQLLLSKKLDIEPEDPMFARKYHDFTDFFRFPFQDRKHLRFKPMPILPHPVLQESSDFFEPIRKQEQLLFTPYQDFRYVIDWIRQAAEDAQVTHITITVYRLAEQSLVIQELIRASQQGKQVTVFIELKARFDEAHNIQWFNKLENAGASVIYSMERLKVHSKILIITRKERGASRKYAYFSTGNFNEDTAQLYSDLGFFTADEGLIHEAEQIMHYILSNKEPEPFREMLVAPFNLRQRLMAHIDQEIANAGAGKPAWIELKVNSLQDPRLVQKLYEASQAGVPVWIIARSICSLVPGVPGLSDNIRVISLVDRLLEHARLCMFCNNEEPRVYIGSADLMKRNLDRRIEQLFPIKDPELQARIRYYYRLQWQDNQKARWIDRNQENHYKQDSLIPMRSQYAFYEYLRAELPAHTDPTQSSSTRASG